jgi:hypothetical protein
MYLSEIEAELIGDVNFLEIDQSDPRNVFIHRGVHRYLKSPLLAQLRSGETWQELQLSN